ncbi:glycosyltransferase [Clostridium neonatale]|uniref:glycosyltransferase n=1 Tax=Clostridium neonatale TaxID=137838 RepID=UPI003D357609
MDINSIKEKVKEVDVVSFDIFDTLLFRIVNEPEDIFTLIEYKLNIPNFKEIRQRDQQIASMKVEKEKHFPHADIDEIYDYIEKESNLDIDWQYVKQYELQMERDSLTGNKEIFEVYKLAKEFNKRVIATSDMYIKKEDIKQFLYKCGFDYFDEIYISSDLKKTKYVGDIFDEVLKREKISPDRMLHIGDNYNSDVINANKRGIKAIHYKFEELDEKRNSSAELSRFGIINEGITNVIKRNNANRNFWYDLGASIGGPLYIGLVKWVEKKCEEKHLKSVYFLSRDGYILHNIFKELHLKDSEYLYTSRRALLLAGIDKLDDDELSSLPPYTFGQRVIDILEYLNIDDINLETIKEAGFNSINDVIRSEEDFDKMKKLYYLNKELVLNRCKEERENAAKYLNKIGFLHKDSLIFDCGWNGSSQYLLDKVLEKIGYNKKNSFLYAGIMDNIKSRLQLENKEFNSYLFSHGYNIDIVNRIKASVVLLELFFGAPHGSVWIYGTEEPILEEIESDHDYKKEILNGIVDYVKQGYDFLKRYDIDIKPEEALSGIFRLIEDPTKEEAVKIGNLTNVDGFVAQKNEKKYLAKLKLRTIIKNPKIEIYWPQGLIARPDTNIIVKYLIAKRFNLRMYKIQDKIGNKVNNMNSNIIEKGIKTLKDQGIATFIYRLNRKLKRDTVNSEFDKYNKFIIENEADVYEVTELDYKPLISIVVPVYNVKDDQLEECINSVINQTYDNWELCLVDDASTWKNVRKTLSKYETNSKINIIYRTENGHISKSTNDGIKVAKGDFIAFLDCDDILAPNAIYEMTKKLNEDPEYDFIYSDEDKLTADGKKRHSPFFKPDWSPDTFMSLMYTCHFSMYRKTIVDEINGLRSEFNGAQDYDFTLRFTEKANKIGHISKLLYHWREREESIASNPEAKPYALKAVKRCKEEALKRRGLKGTVEYVDDMFQYRVKYINNNRPLISIIIPSKDNFDVLKNCIQSIKKYTAYDNYEIILVDNGSNNDNKEKYTKLCGKYNCIYHYEKMEFNFSKMCNIGSRIAKGEYYLFLNDDIEIFTEDWLEIMLGQASLNHVGAVGAKLLYPNTNIIQHIGITNLKIGPSHSQIGFDDRVIYYYGRNRMDYNFIAVTGACLMIEKSKFKQINYFDEELSVAYNDIDLCFKLIEHGYYNIVRNDVVLYHHESISRGNDDISEEKKARLLKERKLLFDKHKKFKGYDPFYNENLTQYKVDYDVNYKLQCNKLIEKNKKIDDKWINGLGVANIDSISIGNIVNIQGWAFISGIKVNNLNCKKIVLIDEDNNNFVFSTDIVIRLDLTSVIRGQGNLNLCGFTVNTDKDLLKKNKYKIALLIENRLLSKKVFVITDKNIELI